MTVDILTLTVTVKSKLEKVLHMINYKSGNRSFQKASYIVLSVSVRGIAIFNPYVIHHIVLESNKSVKVGCSDDVSSCHALVAKLPKHNL